MWTIRLVALVMLALCVPVAAHADSDGYYCVGPGYLAYQFGMAPKPIAPHRVYVLSTRGPKGIPEPAVLELPQFQVHGMSCGEGWIDVASFTAIYRVTLDKDDRPVRYEMTTSFAGQPVPQTFIRSQRQNLGSLGGGWAYPKPMRTSLGAKPPGGEYILEVSAKATDAVKPCELSITSRIVETDDAGREISQRIIFQGRGPRECGGHASPGSTGRPVG
jgi:hypothetical protein